MGMIQSKPIEGRPLPLELIHEMNKFMPLNGLIKCAQANRTLNDLGIPRARKVHAKLISLYFSDVSILAIWFKQWAHKVAEVRAKFLRQTSNRLILDLDLLSSLARQFYNLFIQILKKINEIVKAVQAQIQAGKILDGFNFPPAFQNELRQNRASHIEQALAPAEFELSQWRLQNIPSWNEMLTHFRAILRVDLFEQLNNIFQDHFSHITDNAKTCEEHLKSAAEFLIIDLECPMTNCKEGPDILFVAKIRICRS